MTALQWFYTIFLIVLAVGLTANLVLSLLKIKRERQEIDIQQQTFNLLLKLANESHESVAELRAEIRDSHVKLLEFLQENRRLGQDVIEFMKQFEAKKG